KLVFVDDGIVDAHHVAPSALRTIERCIGGFDEPRHRRLSDVVAPADTDGDRLAATRRRFAGAKRERTAEPLRKVDGLARARVRGQDREFLSTVAEGEITCAGELAEEFSEGCQELVADGVPEVVIDGLEV